MILGVAMMGMFMSGPGQSYSVAAFIDPMLADLGLLRSQYSLAYLVATLISGASLPFVGRALDRLGARLLLPAIALLLGLACLWMAGVRHLLGLYLGLTLVRCLGQGALTLISTWMVGQWFVRRRGMAMGLLGLGSTLSFMAFPAGNLWLIEGYGWRGAWTALAVRRLGAAVRAGGPARPQPPGGSRPGARSDRPSRPGDTIDPGRG